MIFQFRHGDKAYGADLQDFHKLGRPILPHASQQSSAFHLPKAYAQPVHVGSFIGDTRQGGTVNCEEVNFCPHGSGTHTETVGHITKERFFITELSPIALAPAVLLSVSPSAIGRTSENYGPVSKRDDLVITGAGLQEAWAALSNEGWCPKALVLRTLGESSGANALAFDGENPPYLTLEAMAWVRDRGFDHFLTDLPSVDREEDEGQVLAHRLFWSLGDRWEAPSEAAKTCTITEFCRISSDIQDGLYLLTLMIAPIAMDAAPSLPLLYPVLGED